MPVGTFESVVNNALHGGVLLLYGFPDEFLTRTATVDAPYLLQSEASETEANVQVTVSVPVLPEQAEIISVAANRLMRE